MTKRVETPDGDWKGWNWRSEGDILVNGAFFVASGEGAEMRYEKAYSVDPKSASFIDQITFHCGVLGVGGRFGFLHTIQSLLAFLLDKDMIILIFLCLCLCTLFELFCFLLLLPLTLSFFFLLSNFFFPLFRNHGSLALKSQMELIEEVWFVTGITIWGCGLLLDPKVVAV